MRESLKVNWRSTTATSSFFVKPDFFQDLVGKNVEIRLLDEPLYRGKVVSVRGAFVILDNVEQRSTETWTSKSGEHTFNFQYLLRFQIIG